MSAATKNQDSLWLTLFAAWLVALVATVGSLFFSEIMHFPPCSLCWYQRICMYPLTLILLAGLFPLDLSVLKFSLPITLSGFLIAVYHNLLYYKIIPENFSPCTQGVPCSTEFINWFGFVTIPLLSFFGFTLILILLINLYWRKSYEK